MPDVSPTLVDERHLRMAQDAASQEMQEQRLILDERSLGFAVSSSLRALALAAAERPAAGAIPEGWLPIALAPKDGRLIGVAGGCANWNEDGQYWYTAVGHDIGCRIEWEVTHFKSLNPDTIPGVAAAGPPPPTAAQAAGPVFRTGDSVLHLPSDETWAVAYADPDTGKLCALGWPDSEVAVADCTLVRAATDDEHRSSLAQLVASGDRRGRVAQRLYGQSSAVPADPATIQQRNDAIRDALGVMKRTVEAREGMERVRHLKRGTEYDVLHRGVELQVSRGTGRAKDSLNPCVEEDDYLVIYRASDGRLFAREYAEFDDGRFERIADPATPAPAVRPAVTTDVVSPSNTIGALHECLAVLDSAAINFADNSLSDMADEIELFCTGIRAEQGLAQNGDHLGRWRSLIGLTSGTPEAARALHVLFSDPAGGDVSQAARDVLAERRRQVEVEGWTPEHDDQHDERELGLAAACYASAMSPTHLDPKWSLPSAVRLWPWDNTWWKPSSYRNNLVKAGALILAEIERLDRAAPPPSDRPMPVAAAREA